MWWSQDVGFWTGIGMENLPRPAECCVCSVKMGPLPTENRLETLQPTSETKAGMVKMNARQSWASLEGWNWWSWSKSGFPCVFLQERPDIKLCSEASISGHRALSWALGFQSQVMLLDWVCVGPGQMLKEVNVALSTTCSLSSKHFVVSGCLLQPLMLSGQCTPPVREEWASRLIYSILVKLHF